LIHVITRSRMLSIEQLLAESATDSRPQNAFAERP
jgi:hypothetical protein